MSLGLAACGDGRTASSASGSQAVPSGGMTYRTNLLLATRSPCSATAACRAPTVWISQRYCCITTNASMRATSPSPPPTRSTARPAAPTSWDTTGAYPGCVRRPIASAAASAAPIAPSVSTSPLSSIGSMLTSSGLGRIPCRRYPPHSGLRLWRNSLPLFCSNFKSADRPWMNSALKYL